MPGADLGLLKVPEPVRVGVAGTPDEQDTSEVRGYTYEQLSQRNPEYDANLLCELTELFEGGYSILRSASKYAPCMPGEHPDRHKARCAKTSYQPYFGQIVGEFVSELFEQPLTIGAAADADNPETPGKVPDEDFYNTFAKDVDRKDMPFRDLMADVLITALVKRYGFVALDAPYMAPEQAPPMNVAEEKALGTDRIYAYEVPVEQVIDWKVEGDGFAWLIIHTKECDRTTPRGRRNTVIETFMVWEMENGAAVWEKWQIAYPKGKTPDPNAPLERMGGGVTSFPRIPVIRLNMPFGLWVGNKIGPQAREHYSRRCELVGATSDACAAIPYVKRGTEIGAQGGVLPSETQQDPTRGSNPVREARMKGWVAIGADDELGFAEPSGACFEVVDRQLDALKDAMFSVCHQMAASVRPTAGSMGRSGLSKQEDGKSTAKVLEALGKEVREFALKVYKLIADARDEEVEWQAHGLDTYEVDDREAVLEEAISLDQVDIPSETFKRTHKYQVAKKLLVGVDPVTLAQIKKEIEQGVSDEMDHDKLANEAADEQLKAQKKTAGDTQKGLPPAGAKPGGLPAPKGPKTPAVPPIGGGQPGGGKKGTPENRGDGDVPIVKQRSSYACGIACLRSALVYFDLAAPGEKDIEREADIDPKVGVEPSVLMELARDAGLSTEVLKGSTLTAISSLRERGRFVILLVQAFEESPSGYAEGHYVAFQGVEDGKALLMDPDTGKVRRLAVEDFMARWRGIWEHGEKVDRGAIVLRKAGRSS